jgi:hypothetical protein
VTDDLVDARTDTSRELVVTERTRIRISFDTFAMNDLVEFQSRDPGSDGCSSDIEHFASELQKIAAWSVGLSSEGRDGG